MIYNPRARLLYTNASDPTIGSNLAGAATVHSGLAIELNDACDVWLAVFVTGTSTGTTPTLDVYLDGQDSAGNWFNQLVHAPQITTAPASSSVSAGIHMAGAGALVLPATGRITVVLGGTTPVYPQVTISLFGR